MKVPVQTDFYCFQVEKRLIILVLSFFLLRIFCYLFLHCLALLVKKVETDPKATIGSHFGPHSFYGPTDTGTGTMNRGCDIVCWTTFKLVIAHEDNHHAIVHRKIILKARSQKS